MDKEEIEEIKRLLFQDRLTQYGKRILVQYLEQKESILDKVTDKLEEDAREEEGYIKWLDERSKKIVQPRKTIVIKSDYARSILKIIEGEKK